MVRMLPSDTPKTPDPAPPAPALAMDPLLLATVRVSTFDGDQGLTNATGFFFEREDRLYLVSSRHVFIDEPSKHHPSRIELELHTDGNDLGASIGLSMLLFKDGKANWRQGQDPGGEIDVAVLRIDRAALPPKAAIAAFTVADLQSATEPPRIGEPLLIAGFPLGFHDALHHLPVVRQGIVASPYGWRFQGKACFLTDARAHRGISGAPVVVHTPGRMPLPWRLAGIHSSRLDIGTRDLEADESLGLNMAWYPDILLTLTQDEPPA